MSKYIWFSSFLISLIVESVNNFHLSGLANQSSLPSFLQHVFKEELKQEQIIGYYFHLSLGQHAQVLYLVRLDAVQLPFIQFLPILKQDKVVILPQYCEFVAKDFLQSPLLRSKYHRSTFIPQELHPQVLSALIFCHIHHHIMPVFGGHFQLPQPSRQDIFVPQA